jgi:hypothetical protein
VAAQHQVADQAQACAAGDSDAPALDTVAAAAAAAKGKGNVEYVAPADLDFTVYGSRPGTADVNRNVSADTGGNGATPWLAWQQEIDPAAPPKLYEADAAFNALSNKEKAATKMTRKAMPFRMDRRYGSSAALSQGVGLGVPLRPSTAPDFRRRQQH